MCARSLPPRMVGAARERVKGAMKAIVSGVVITVDNCNAWSRFGEDATSVVIKGTRYGRGGLFERLAK